MKKIKYLFVIIVALFAMCLGICAIELDLSGQSACLMEASTGRILYEKNADEKLEPASVTKIMSLILVFEAIDEGLLSMETPITATAHSASMGGSQIWLEEGETMTVHDMLKAVCVASANDCTVALAEAVSGSEESFVAKMNEMAQILGMTNTHFSNCTGLPTENHYTTARDIALMTRELHKHKAVYDYTKIWTDTLRGGEFGITNTNKLVRFYNGATGMKTGYTSSALYCMSATAERNGMHLIAAVMKSESSDKRFNDAKKLLEHGFANYEIYTPEQMNLPKLKVLGGVENEVALNVNLYPILIEKGRGNKIKCHIELDEKISAPFGMGTEVGKVTFEIGEEIVATHPITTKQAVSKITFGEIFKRLFLSSITIR